MEVTVLVTLRAEDGFTVGSVTDAEAFTVLSGTTSSNACAATSASFSARAGVPTTTAVFSTSPTRISACVTL